MLITISIYAAGPFCRANNIL